jgi:hypothetical protein
LNKALPANNWPPLWREAITADDAIPARQYIDMMQRCLF